MNYGWLIPSCQSEIPFLFLCFSRAGVPEKYCADIERKVHGDIHVNHQSHTDTQPVH